MLKNKKIPQIIVPTLFIGGIQPENAKEGDVWIIDKGDKYDFFVYLSKWFPIINVKETDYTEEQEKLINKYKTEQETKLEKYEKLFKAFKEVLECTN